MTLRSRPDPIQLPKTLATILSTYTHTAAPIPPLIFADVREARGIKPTFGQATKGKVSVTDTGEALLQLEGHFDVFAESTPVQIELVDGSVITTNHAYLTRQGGSVVGRSGSFDADFELTEWQWSTGKKPVAWVGALRGAGVRVAYNLLINGHNYESYTSLRLEGNAAWHLVRKGAFGRRTQAVVIDTAGAPVDRAGLWHDFAALEFLLGSPLRLDVLVGVDENNVPVAAYGPSFGYRYRTDANHDPPLPDETDATWLAVAFPLVARALNDEPPNAVTIAVSAYVDSLVGHIDGQYLFAQVGLEALANRLTPDKLPLVRDESAWRAWVKSARPTWAAHARDEKSAGDMHTKLKDVARPTTSSMIRDLFRRWKIEVPDEGITEIRGRNIVAHTGTMNEDGIDYDIERDTRRVRIIRTLVAAMVLRHVGYDGALAGWDLDLRRWRAKADWFPVSDKALEASRRTYKAIAPPTQKDAPG